MTELDAKRHPGKYRLSRYSIPWFVAALILVPYEIIMILQGHEGGPLSHVVWWATGPRFELRWWLVAPALDGFLLWLILHFSFETPGWRALVWCVLLGLFVGCVGAIATR